MKTSNKTTLGWERPSSLDNAEKSDSWKMRSSTAWPCDPEGQVHPEIMAPVVGQVLLSVEAGSRVDMARAIALLETLRSKFAETVGSYNS